MQSSALEMSVNDTPGGRAFPHSALLAKSNRPATSCVYESCNALINAPEKLARRKKHGLFFSVNFDYRDHIDSFSSFIIGKRIIQKREAASATSLKSTSFSLIPYSTCMSLPLTDLSPWLNV